VSDNLEQWINVQLWVKTGKSASPTLAVLILVYGEYPLKKSRVLEWRRQLKEGREDALDDPRGGSQNRKGQMQM
jgi:hypothetical protein